MKKKYRLMACTIILLSLVVLVGTVNGFTGIVTGENNPQNDVKNIQTAVDKGGSVLLKGIFDFGEKGQVLIKNDIELTGENDANGNPLTKIKGGFWSFYTALPSTELPISSPGPKMKIKNIHFDGATWTPLHFPYTSGSEISGNRITNVKPYAVPVKWAGGETLLVSAGTILGTRFAHREKILPGAVTGHLIFENNTVDLKCENPSKTMSQGAFCIWTWGATIEINSNRIRNVSRNSIESLDNYLDEEGRGSVVIAENNVVTPAVGIPFPTPTTPNGIIVGWFLDMTGGSDPERRSKITVIRNYIQTNGASSVGIASLADGTTILGNHVEINGGPESKGISQLGSNGFIARNKIDGHGAWGLQTVSFRGVKADGNTFAWNDVKGFKASAGDILCAGNKNTLIGAECKVVDTGKYNKTFNRY